MANQAMLNSNSYKTYYAITTRAEPPKTKKTQKKSDSTISSEKTPSKKKPTKAKKDVPSTKKPTTKLKPTKKKAPVKADRGKSDETDFQSRVLDEQQCKISITDEGTGTKPGVPDVPKYDSESNKESWGDSGEEDDDDEDDTEDDRGNDDGDDSDGNDDDDDNDGNDDDDNDGNDDDDDNDGNDDDIDYKRTASDRDENPNINQSNEEHKEEEENVDKFTNEEDDAKEENKEELDNAEELYKDEEEDAHVTLTAIAQKTEGPMQSSFVSYEFTKKLPKFKNISPTDNEIAFLMDTTATPTPTPTTSKVINAFPTLPEFTSVFRFNERVTNLEKDLSEMKQVDQYAQAISSVPAIVDRYIENKQRESIRQAIHPHTAKCREEALADSKEYIDLIDTYMRAIIKEEVNSQLPHILPQVVSKFATPVIEQNVTESLEVVMEEHKSYLRADYKRELYDALVNTYNNDKDLFDTYGETQEFDTSNNDEQPDNEAVSKSDWYKKPKQPPTPDPDWNKRQQVDFRPSQTWISNLARAEKPPTSFDELMDTPIDFSAFVMNWLNIANLTQELLVGLAFNLLKGTSQQPSDLIAYSNSDYAGASLDRKSTTGGCQFLGCRIISWQCKKQTIVANSTTKAEYIAASNCCGL
ncbi:hypothetical protein Tco_0369571, partial [Tanacetum coccineum]